MKTFSLSILPGISNLAPLGAILGALLPLAAHAVPESNLTSELKSVIQPYFEQGTPSAQFAGVGNIPIHYRVFESANEKAALVILPGKGEPMKKYAELIYDLRDSGYSIYILDHRGQGESGRMTANPKVNHIGDYHDWTYDLDTFVRTVVQSKPHAKTFLLAHSMGGAIAANYLIDHPDVFDRAVLSSPMLGIDTSPLPQVIAYLIASASDSIGKAEDYALTQGPFDPQETMDQSNMSHSPARFEATRDLLIDHPELEAKGVSFNWIEQCFQMNYRIWKNRSQVKTPVLLFQAGEDSLVTPSAQDDFCEDAKNCVKSTFPGARHEILMEVDPIRDRALAEIQAFLK